MSHTALQLLLSLLGKWKKRAPNRLSCVVNSFFGGWKRFSDIEKSSVGKNCLPGEIPSGEFKSSVYLKVDVATLQPVGTSFVEEVDVFNEQAEERDDNLQDSRKRKGVIWQRQCWGGFPCDSPVCGLCAHTVKGKGLQENKEERLIFISWEKETFTLFSSYCNCAHSSLRPVAACINTT